MKRKRRAAAPLRRGPAILLGDGCLLLLVRHRLFLPYRLLRPDSRPSPAAGLRRRRAGLPRPLSLPAAGGPFPALLAAAWVLAVRRLWQPLALGAEALRVDVVNTVSASLELGFTLEPALSLPEAL